MNERRLENAAAEALVGLVPVVSICLLDAGRNGAFERKGDGIPGLVEDAERCRPRAGAVDLPRALAEELRLFLTVLPRANSIS